jgi:hypothetical protein
MAIATQDWDGVTAPALPSSGWTFSSNLDTSTAVTGITPTSSPNMLALTATGSQPQFATYNTQDGNSGNVVVQANFNTSAINSAFTAQAGLVARAGSTTLDTSSTTWCAGYLDFDQGKAALEQYVSGTHTALGTLTISGAIAADTWYTLELVAAGSTVSLIIVRADGYYLGSNGQWQAPGTPTACISGTTTISGQGYSGLYLLATTGVVYSDDWSLSAAAVPPSVRPPVLVAYYPYQYYPAWAE